jgi:hypothetical protein
MLESTGEQTKLSSIWLQFIWLAVGSTVKTWDLIKLYNNSIPTAPSIHLSDGRTLHKNARGQKGADKASDGVLVC